MHNNKNQKKRGIIIGRFQPYHLGHHNAVKNILHEIDELVIVIGSSDDSYTIQNPFTSGERLEMITSALKKDGLYEKCFICQVPDVNENSLWTSKIISYCPAFEVVYTNNPLVRQLFEKAGYATKKMVSNLKDIDGVKTRQLMLSGKDWKTLVPKSVSEYLEKIGAEQRIKAIIEKEEKE